MKRYLVIAVIYCSLLVGCSGIFTESPEQNASSGFLNQDTLLENPILDYEVPVSTPNVTVNQMGYLTNMKKIAVFKGKEMPEEFLVYDKQTKEVVYTGKVELDNEAANGEYMGYGDFTELEKEGEYYIEAPILGRSYSFLIGDEIYDTVFEQSCLQYYYSRCGITLTEEYAGENVRNACHAGKAVLREDISIALDVSGGWHQDEMGSKDVKAACLAAGTLLLSYEVYDTAFTDDVGIPESKNGIPDILDEIAFEVEWMLKMQDATTGGVYSALTIYEKPSEQYPISPTTYVEPVNLEATAAFCALLAKFSYIYQSYDAEYATMCLKAADRAWKYLQNYDDQLEEVSHLSFWAATELYRASGYQTYHGFALEYLRTDAWKDYTIKEAMLGSVTYISTKKNVNMEQCDNIIAFIMNEAGEISRNAKKSPYLAAADESQTNQDELLNQMFLLNIVNYIITNMEYETVINDHIHYFMGRNETGISYIDNVGVRNYINIDKNLGVMRQINRDAEFIFLLSGIMK